MEQKILSKALYTCCKMSGNITCKGCPLYPLKMNGINGLTFLCLTNHEPTRKTLEAAIEKVVRENPKAFPEEVVRAIIRQAKVV